MPELPDVESFKQYLEATALRKKIVGVQVRNRKVLDRITPEELNEALRNRRLENSRRLGKHLLVELNQGSWLFMHFGMTGSLAYFKEEAPEPDYTRVRFDFDNGAHLAYVSQRLLGRVGLTENPGRYGEKHQLGPDALDEHLDWQRFRNALDGSRAMVKAALMDQHLLAGIGNVYSDEILFQASIHPRAKAGDLSEKELRNLFQTMKRVLQTAVKHGADPAEFPGTYLTRHRQAGEKCPKCGGTVRSEKIGGRTAYFCPSCQSPP